MIKKVRNHKQKKGFTLIELIVVMAIIAILVLLAAPRFLGKTDDANATKHISNARTLEEASERYFIDQQDWPRLTDEPYNGAEINEYAERVRDVTGEEVTLTEGNYYDIDYESLSQYANLPSEGDRGNYILRNPVGKIYYLENLTEEGKERNPIGPMAVIDGVERELEVGNNIDFSYTRSDLTVTLPAGTYQLETWGGKGGYYGGNGGYARGTLGIVSETTLLVRVGGQGETKSLDIRSHALGGWNGGGRGYSGSNSDSYKAGLRNGGGGGATDMRTADTSLYGRILVAGGGGGSSNQTYGSYQKGGFGGGLAGGYGTAYSARPYQRAKGGTQTIAGTGRSTTGDGKFGDGGRGYGTSDAGGGGGAGWYGGAGGGSYSGAGGSGYALTDTSYKPIGYTPTSEYHLTNTQLIAGNQTMPNPNGGTMTGNSGHGFARITVVE